MTDYKPLCIITAIIKENMVPWYTLQKLPRNLKVDHGKEEFFYWNSVILELIIIIFKCWKNIKCLPGVLTPKRVWVMLKKQGSQGCDTVPTPKSWFNQSSSVSMLHIECFKKFCLNKESPSSSERLPNCAQVGDKAGAVWRKGPYWGTSVRTDIKCQKTRRLMIQGRILCLQLFLAIGFLKLKPGTLLGDHESYLRGRTMKSRFQRTKLSIVWSLTS